MDPEIIAQLEEQLRELTDTISRQTSMMGQQMDAMNKMAGSSNENAKANAGATQTTTKYQEAQQKATAEQEKSVQTLKKFESALGVLSASVGAAAGVFGSIANSLLSSQKGLSKYGAVADEAAAGAEKLAGSIPIVGDALGALVGTLGKIAAKVAKDGLALVDSLTDLRDGLVKTGGSLPVTAGQLADLAKDARYSGENMKVLGKITESLGTGLRSLDATAGRGAVKFMEMANVTDETRRQFGRMGVDQERLTELQALYVKQQQASGNSYDLQTKTAAQLRRESLAYAENMQKLSALTGKQAEQLQAEQEAVAAVVQERMATLKDMADEKRLRDAGRGEEADAIKAEREKRQKFAQELQKMGLTQDEQMKAMQMYRLGAYTDYTKSMAQLNPGLMSLAQGVKNGSINVEQGAKEFGEGLTEGKIRMSTNLNGIADAIDPSVLGDTFGLTSETLKAPLDQLGKSLGEAKEAADADTTAAKTRTDEVGDSIENIKSAEREMQAKYQDFLMTQIESISKLINQVDIFTEIQEHAATVAKAMAAGLVAVTAGSAALSIAAARATANLNRLAMSGGLGGGGDMGPLGDAESGGKKPRGRFGRFLGKAGRFLGRAGGLLAIGTAAYEGYTGYKEAEELEASGQITAGEASKKKGEAVGGAVGGGVGGLAGGALAGAAIGSVVPVVGTAIGGLIGGALGYFAGKAGGSAIGGWLAGGDSGKSAEQIAREKQIAELKKRTEEAKKAIGAPAAGTAAAGVAATGQLTQAEMNQKILEEQLEQNKKLYQEPLQQTEEERKKQKELFDGLNNSMGTFRKNLDNTSKAFLDLMQASDEVYRALTGRDRPGSENTNGPGAAPGAPPGSDFTGGANTTATTENVMAMQYARESAGGKNLRAKGLGNAQSMGGAYGMGKAAREDTFASMSKEERAAFTAATGFTRAPTLDELVNKEGTAFLSEKARLADEMLAKKLTENTITRLTKQLGRAPTMKDLRGSHWLGPAGYPAFLEALAKNPNMTMAQFYAQHPEWTTPDMKQFGGPNTTLAQFEQTLIEHSGGRGTATGLAGAATRATGALNNLADSAGFPPAASSGGVEALGRYLQSAYNLRVSEHPAFGGVKGQHSRTGGHYEGNAIDVNMGTGIIEANHPEYNALFDRIARAGAQAGYHTLWKSPDGNHHNHIHFQYSGSMGANSKIGAARGGIFRGPKDGYPMELHGTEMILPIDTPSMQGSKIFDLMTSLTKTGVKEGGIGKINRIQDAIMQVVNNETTKAIKAVNEANVPMQNISNEISNSMRQVMEAHNKTMNELTYKLGDMIDALNTSNDVTKKILKKASA